MFFVTQLNHSYWVLGATLGGVFGSLISFNTEGPEFVMTALFIVIFVEQWMKEEKHISSLVGLGASIVCLLIFWANNFIIPAMIAILGLLTFLRKSLEKAEEKTVCDDNRADYYNCNGCPRCYCSCPSSSLEEKHVSLHSRGNGYLHDISTISFLTISQKIE